jgi:hypothetical protein
MDPWLEHPALWPDVHNSLIAALRDAISDQLPDRYFVALEERTIISVPWEPNRVFRPDLIIASDSPAVPGPMGSAPQAEGDVLVLDIEFPNEPITETYLEIREVEGGTLVTAIEFLSPSNKVHGDTHKESLAKRHKLMLTLTNLVEIDLLRVGDPMPLPIREDVRLASYRIIIRRARAYPSGRLYASGSGRRSLTCRSRCSKGMRSRSSGSTTCSTLFRSGRGTPSGSGMTFRPLPRWEKRMRTGPGRSSLDRAESFLFVRIDPNGGPVGDHSSSGSGSSVSSMTAKSSG